MIREEINHINSKDIKVEELTPAMQEYLKIKHENPDKILLYRLGDFYETFFEDAVTMSKVLEITLTGREQGKFGRIPLAGIPVKSLDNYLEKLINKNYKVVICDQLEDPKFAKGIVKRGVTRIVTSGTLTETDFLKQNNNNYICATFKNDKNDVWGFAYADISTGEFKVTQASFDLILSELMRINPSEVIGPSVRAEIQPFQIVPEEKINLPEEITNIYNCSKIPAKVFDENFAKNNLEAVFKSNLEAFGYSRYKTGFCAAGALLAYIWENMKDNVPKFERIEPYELSEYVILDGRTRKNLELLETNRKETYGSLIWAIDKTKTNMGSRLLKSMLCQPLKKPEDILKRQNVVSELVEKNDTRINISNILEQIYDIQRIATRMSNGSLSPKEFINLKFSLFNVPKLLDATGELENNPLENINQYKDDIEEFANLIDQTICDDPSPLIKEGNIIKSGVSGELDYLRDLLTGGENWLEKFSEKEREKTGIKNLKVGFNKVFGYFIEISNSNLDSVPDNYVRKQTLTNGERFITEELKKHEDDVLNAKYRIGELEYSLFTNFREYSKEYVTKIREIAEAVAKCDVCASLATVAVENNYTKPVIDDSDDFIIKNGRHAVLEKILPLGEYVPNDLELKSNSTDKTQFMILTGPNMAGKSTYMRQAALIIIMAALLLFNPFGQALMRYTAGLCLLIYGLNELRELPKVNKAITDNYGPLGEDKGVDEQ